MRLKKSIAARLRKRITVICLLFLFFLSGLKGSVLSAAQQETSETPEVEYKTSYWINETTSIKSDFHHLGIELLREKYKYLEDILRSDLISMICLDSSLYVYWALPEGTNYQLNYMIINGRKYENGMRVLDTNGVYRKYVFSDFDEVSDNQYEITEVEFQNKDGERIKYAVEISCKMGEDNGRYFFEKEMKNNIVLVGMLLESIYQFDNEKLQIFDAWDNVWNNIEGKDSDQRSFYYFAFNCFDRQIGHYFTPDEIQKIVIEYTINQYQFKGKKQDYREAALVRTEQQIQIVTPETIHVGAKNKWNSNGKAYEYNTIYKLAEANVQTDKNDEDKKDRTANINTLLTAQQAGYEWVVHFGNTQGYRYAENFTENSDVDYTMVEDFAAINMEYTYRGESYSAATDTILNREVVTRREEDHTESIIKQFGDHISITVESAGHALGNLVAKTLGLSTDFIGGILKNMVIRIIVIVFVILLILVVIIKIVC